MGWGSTRGAIEEAVDRARQQGTEVSSMHIKYLSPLQPGIKEIFSRFDKVMTVEINHSDAVGSPKITADNRRTGQLATVLRSQTLVDVDCWSLVPGHPLPPNMIVDQILARVKQAN